MTALDIADRDRLAGCLALAESASNPHDPERLAAIAAAERLLARRGMRLRDLAAGSSPHGPGPERARRPAPWREAWRETVRRCRAMPHSLKPWEKTFLAGLDAFPRLSPKQRGILREIAERLHVAEAAE